MKQALRISSIIQKSLNPSTTLLRSFSTKPTTGRISKSGEDDWNDAWETAWLPDDLPGKNRAPWETDDNFSLSDNSSAPTTPTLPADVDAETKAFVEDMTDNWEQRRGSSKTLRQKPQEKQEPTKTEGNSLYSLENLKRDYRLKKQRIHAGLWMKEIDKQEEAKLGDPMGGGDDIERLLDSCSEIFDSGHDDANNAKTPNSSEFKSKPDGWETTTKAEDGSVWEMTQREEDILLQEFERRIAYSKFQIASFIKSHIFSRRRPIDGWKYMIEVIGPNARKGKGSVSRLASLSDPSTQPFKEEIPPIARNSPSILKRR